MVLEYASMTNFCGIPLASLRENSITELNLDLKRIPQGRRRAWSDRAEQVAALCRGAHVAQVRTPASARITSPRPATLLLPLARSLDGNQLCNEHIHSIHSSSGQGTYTLVGIIKLCEALKGSAVASLECAAAS